jgi:hypothetical protein
MAVRRLVAFPVAKTDEAEPDRLVTWSQTQPLPAGTAALWPIGFDGDSFGVAAVSETGEMLTQTVSFSISPPLSPELSARLDIPVIEREAFPPVQEAYRLVQGTANFGAEIGWQPYSVLAVHPARAWTAKGVRVAAAGEPLTVRTVNGGETSIIITEWLGSSPLDVFVSPALRRLLEQRGVNVNELVQNAAAPNLRQRMLPTRGGQVAFRAPDPPLDSMLVQKLKTVQVMIWSPVPITVVEREG